MKLEFEINSLTESSLRSVSEGVCEVMDSEPSLKWFVVLWLGVDLSQGVVAGDEDALRPELDATSFCLCWERILVCPLLEVVAADLVGS